MGISLVKSQEDVLYVRYQSKPPGGEHHHISGVADRCKASLEDPGQDGGANRFSPVKVLQTQRVFPRKKGFDPSFFASFWLLGGACHEKKKARDKKSVRRKAM